MKCPQCGVNHRSYEKARSCYMKIENEWCHYVILTHSKPGGATEDNLKSYEGLDLGNFRRVKELRAKMIGFLKHKGWEA